MDTHHSRRLPLPGHLTRLLRRSLALPLATLALAPAFAVLAGCSYQLVSPPARMINLESARTAAPGETVAGVHAAGYAAVFDPAVAVGSVGVRRGVAPGIEVDADATWAHLSYSGFPDINRNVYTGRLGLKAANDAGWGALYAGGGGGHAPAAGSFAALDLGAVLSYPSCYVVPFANAAIFASVPFDTKQVDFRNPDGTLVASSQAQTTAGFGVSAGIEIPLDHDRCRQGLTPARIQLGLSGHSLIPTDGPVRTTTTTGDGLTTTTERDGRYGAVGFAVGFELPFQ